jgi:outer membrane protein assembly factor BamE (lipoprotein component of BamABCDE complex)
MMIEIKSRKYLQIMIYTTINKLLIVLFLSISISGCQYTRTSGELIADEQIKRIESHKMNKSQVEDELGTPSIIPDFSQDTWYYVYRKSTYRSFLKDDVKEQKVVKVNFVNDIVAKIDIYDGLGEDVIISTDHTVTKGTYENPVQLYMKNIGRFKSAGKNKPPKRR